MSDSLVIRHYILATAGHVDHGKSSIVRTLTGVDPDRLPEEKARGITIELGFAELRLTPSAETSPNVVYQVGIVDVPGHEDYIRNMVAGVGSVDAALLVVAADDGWMPQTEEHLQILTYLGVKRGVVALSKADLAADLAGTIAAIREKLSGSPLAEAEIAPTSVPTGGGFAELRKALARVLAMSPPQPDIGKPRHSVDRAFTVQGIGAVVTGTLAGGALRRGQEIVIQPSGQKARIRGIQTHNRDVEQGLPGSRIALNVPGLSPTPREHRTAGSICRGDVVTIAELGPAVRTLDVSLERSPRAAAAGTRAIRNGVLLRVHLGSRVVAARLRLLENVDLPPGGRAVARLRLSEPLFALAGDRFILRDWAEQQTLAGGVVLDPDPPRSRRERAAQLALLQERAANSDDAAIFVRTLLARDGVDERASVLRRSRFSAAQIEHAITAEAEQHRLISLNRLVVEATWWKSLLNAARTAVDAGHRAHPELGSIPFTDLRAAIAPMLRSPAARAFAADLAEAAIAALCAEGYVRTAAGLRSSNHRPALPPRLREAGESLRRVLAEHPFDPPNRRELCRSDAAMQAMRFLIATGEAVDLGPEVVISADAYARAIATVRSLIGSSGPATVSEIKEALRSSRRVVVPLCEKLDRDRITRREGDRRLIANG